MIGSVQPIRVGMTVVALGMSPFEWIVNSNALGVAFVSKESGFRVAFLSRHAVRRLADRSLLGFSAEELLDEPARTLADVVELGDSWLADPGNYPAVVRAEINGRHLELAISPVTGDEDQYLGVMVTFKDVTVDIERLEASNRFKDLMADHASNGRSEADQTEAVAAGLSTAVSTVQGHGAQIAQLVEQLTTINNQTRMLSLNASIESVRAGDAGRAFRIIADEVGELALRTQSVTSEVERILKTIDIDSRNAADCTSKVVDSVASLIATQRAMDQEVQAQH